MTREPETEAGRSLVRSGETGALGARPGLLTIVLAIEAELRASLAAQVRALEPFGERTHDADWGWRDCRNAAAALIEGTDPASPEPWDQPYFADGSSLASSPSGIHQDTVMRMKEKRRRELLRATPPAGSTIPPLDDVERLALALIEHRADPAQYTRGATHVCASRRCAADILARLQRNTHDDKDD